MPAPTSCLPRETAGRNARTDAARTRATFDIYVRKGAQPTTSEYDHRGYTSSADEKIRIEPVEPGDYYIMVRSYRGTGSFSLEATIG